MKEPEITVSDHAVIRYIERQYGFSLDGIRKQITDLVRGAVGVGAASHTVGDVTFCFEKARSHKGIVVTTVLERGMKRQKWMETHKG